MEKTYGPNFLIKKDKCTNHLLRNYINRMRDISVKRKNGGHAFGRIFKNCNVFGQFSIMRLGDHFLIIYFGVLYFINPFSLSF